MVELRNEMGTDDWCERHDINVMASWLRITMEDETQVRCKEGVAVTLRLLPKVTRNDGYEGVSCGNTRGTAISDGIRAKT